MFIFKTILLYRNNFIVLQIRKWAKRAFLSIKDRKTNIKQNQCKENYFVYENGKIYNIYFYVVKCMNTFLCHFHFQFISDINECQSSPCVNGNCTNHVNNYTCECQPGFTGVNCDKGLFIIN